MKKIVLSVAVLAAAAFVACTSTPKAEQASAITSKIENCTNPDSLKVYVDQAKEYVETLVKEGKIEEAKAYMAKIEPVVKEKAPALASTFATIGTALDKVQDAVSTEAVSSAADSLKAVATDSISAAASNVAAAGEAAVEGAKEGVKEKIGDITEKGKEAVGTAVDKTKEVAGKGKDAVVNAYDKSKDAVSSTAEKGKEAAEKVLDKIKK